MITKPRVIIKREVFIFVRNSKELQQLAWCLVTRSWRKCIVVETLWGSQGARGQVSHHYNLPKKVKRAMASRWSLLTHHRRSGVTLSWNCSRRMLCSLYSVVSGRGVKRPVQVLSYDEYIEAMLATCCCP